MYETKLREKGFDSLMWKWSLFLESKVKEVTFIFTYTARVTSARIEFYYSVKYTIKNKINNYHHEKIKKMNISFSTRMPHHKLILKIASFLSYV